MPETFCATGEKQWILILEEVGLRQLEQQIPDGLLARYDLTLASESWSLKGWTSGLSLACQFRTSSSLKQGRSRIRCQPVRAFRIASRISLFITCNHEDGPADILMARLTPCFQSENIVQQRGAPPGLSSLHQCGQSLAKHQTSFKRDDSNHEGPLSMQPRACKLCCGVCVLQRRSHAWGSFAARAE